ncbi:MAG: LON peptidase substrate-binding domain-containing protein [Rhodospirillales bacterium]|nr:LON peptidase substrate-binding domain-containing protein [Alphaproteobacteria bacterium]MCB9986644.1 LON peptidase substrate-binding domain-containing protein [Rhodospirillales bacterium]USO06828.1 MAG: LON peptidase substrate-binding domain-containing protein [Rhodospirillales bacterium]
MHSCNLTFDKLPHRLPVFPLTGVLLLPRGQLPLNVFEKRYLKMVDAALRDDRLIGIVQPRSGSDGDVYDIGCAGRIVSFAEAEGGRYRITLTGICRFRIGRDLDESLPYRTVVPEWNAYTVDMEPQADTVALDRCRLNRLLQSYFRQQEMSCDWDKVDIAPDSDLLTALEMICPLKPSEKQALLEADTIQRRAELFLAMIEMAVSHPCMLDETGGCCH